MLHDDSVDLWAKAAELERQFAGYKQRLAERKADVVAVDDDDGGDGGDDEGVHGEVGGGDGRGRMYKVYMRRRDERLREGWRARMERKEAEVKALWARLERQGGGGGGRAGGGLSDRPGIEQRTENIEEKRSSDVTPRSISGKKHTLTRSFSSYTATSSRPVDVTRRRALSQEPPGAAPPVATVPDPRTDNRVPSTTTTPRKPKVLSWNKSSVKAGLKPPRSQHRRTSSGDLKELVLPNTDAAVQTSSSEQVDLNETQKTSCPTNIGSSAKARAASLASDCSEVLEHVADGEAEAKNVGVDKGGDEKITVSSDKLGNGEITGDSDTEPSYVYIEKDNVKVIVRSSETFDVSDAEPELGCKKDNGEEITAPSDTLVAESATMKNVEVGAASGESSGSPCSNIQSSFSDSSGADASALDSPLNSLQSCSSESIDQLLEADAALLRKKREEIAEKGVLIPGTPNSRISSTTQTPKETVRGLKKFLSFGRKNKGSGVTVNDCSSPSVAYLVDDHSVSGGCQSTDSIKPRMGSSDAGSDDLDHSYAVSPLVCSLQSLVTASPAKSELDGIVPREKSPKGHRSFFSFRSFKCGGN